MSWKTLRKFYVYTYYKNNEPYYVGMGQNNRVIAKHKYVEVPLWDNIKIVDNLSEYQAAELEIQLINQFGMKCNNTGILENLQAGGKTQKSGWRHAEVTKQAISKNNTGKIRTAEHRKNYSKPKTAEHAENIKVAVSSLWADPAYKQQRLQQIKSKPFAHKGKPWSEARRNAQNKKQQNKGITS